VQRVAIEVGARLVAARAAEALVTDLKRRSLPVTERAGAAVQRALAGNDVDVVRALTVDERRVVIEARLLAAIRRYRVAVAELRRAAGGKLPVGPAAGPRESAPPAAGAPADPAPGKR
jgi:outer membrane protein, heavy metal efflux system